MNETIFALEQSGWIAKVENPDNKRVLLVSLTPAGQELLDRCDKIIDQIEQEIFAGLDAAAVVQLRSALQTVMATATSAQET